MSSTEKKLFKEIDIGELYGNFVKEATPELIAREALKNIFEHGVKDSKVYISVGADGGRTYVDFFNQIKSPEEMTLEKMKGHLMTYNRKEHAMRADYSEYREKHFHQGMCYYQRYRVEIECGKVRITTMSSEDYPNLYIYIEDESDEAELVDGWKLRIYSEEVSSIIEDVIGEFYFDEKYKFQLYFNGKRYYTQTKKFDLEKFDKYAYYDDNCNTQKIYHKMTFDAEHIGELQIFWALSTEGIYQSIPINFFNGNHVSGEVLLTSNTQLANEGRLELKKDIQSKINGIIKKISDAHKSEIELKEKLSEYTLYRDNFINMMISNYRIAKSRLMEQFFDADDSKEERLEHVAKYYLRLISIYDMLGINEQAPEYKYFQLSGVSVYAMDESDFSEINDNMDFNLLKVMPKFKFGHYIASGDHGRTVTSKELIYERGVLLVDLSSNSEEDFTDTPYVETVLMPYNDDYYVFLPNEMYDFADPEKMTKVEDKKLDEPIIDDIGIFNVGYDPKTAKFIETDFDTYGDTFCQEHQEETIEEIKINGYTYYLQVARYEKDLCKPGNILYLYNTEADLERESTHGLSLKLYRAWSKAIALMLNRFDIKATAFPAIYFDKNEYAPQTAYDPNTNVFALNAAIWTRHKRQSSNVFQMMILAAEAIAYIRFGQRGSSHEIEMKQMLMNLLMPSSFFQHEYFYDEIKDYLLR